MKLAYVATYLPQHCGIATYTDYLIHGIRANAPELPITIIAENGAEPIEEKNFKVIPCWNRNEDYTRAIIDRAKEFDLVHIQHEYSIYKFDDRLPTVLEALKGKVKVVITIHCVRPAQFSERGDVDERYAARIARIADTVIVHLESQKAILERLGIPTQKIRLIPHGSEITNVNKEVSRQRLGLPEDGKIIISFGFVKPHKCHHIMVEALREIVDNGIDAYLFIAGGLAPSAGKKEKEYLDLVKKKIDQLNLNENVIFPNRFFPNEDVPYILRAGDLVLFPYYEEDRSASGSFHLSIGAKRPIIASRIPKFEELKNISDELLVLPYNATGIARIAIRIFRDEKFRHYIEKRTDVYREMTSWQSVGRMHLKVYEE